MEHLLQDLYGVDAPGCEETMQHTAKVVGNIVGKLDSSATRYVKVIIVVRALHPNLEAKRGNPRKKRKNAIFQPYFRSQRLNE